MAPSVVLRDIRFSRRKSSIWIDVMSRDGTKSGVAAYIEDEVAESGLKPLVEHPSDMSKSSPWSA
jgi:hypothetical protein